MNQTLIEPCWQIRAIPGVLNVFRLPGSNGTDSSVILFRHKSAIIAKTSRPRVACLAKTRVHLVINVSLPILRLAISVQIITYRSLLTDSPAARISVYYLLEVCKKCYMNY